MTDTQGKRLIELCQSTSLVIGNGRLYGDLGIGEYTYHSMNGSSMVDYFILNPHDLKNVTDFNILEPNEFSDHSGIEIKFAQNSLLSKEILDTKDKEMYIHCIFR